MRASLKSGASVLLGVPRHRVAASLMVVMAMSFATSCLAAAKGSFVIIVNGATIKTCPNSDDSACSQVTSRTEGTGYVAEVRNVASAGTAGVSASMSGTPSGQASISIESGGYTFLLTPPSPRPNLANGRLVLYMQLDGQLSGNATVDAAVQVDVLTMGPLTSATGSAQGSLADQPGGDSLAFEVPVVLASDFPSTGRIQVIPNLVVKASASISGGSFQTASANAYDGKLKVVGFRVFDSSGTQVTGFWISGSRAIPELEPTPPGLGGAIEFYNAAFQHYFISTNTAEIANLDSGATPGWERTGQAFHVYATSGAGLVGVCRFLGVFPPKSTHFYVPEGPGCNDVLTKPDWKYEGIVFYTALPDTNGGCPAGNVPVYRLYNNSQGGAPNHRFTTSQTIQEQMSTKPTPGYIPEGSGTGVGMCSPH